MDEGLPRARRIRRRADFLRVQEEGARVSTKHFVLLVAPRPNDVSGLARLGIVASKKVGGAPQRNRVKRRLREAFRRKKASFPDGFDVVVIARAGADGLAQADVDAEIDRALPQLVKKSRKRPDDHCDPGGRASSSSRRAGD